MPSPNEDPDVDPDVEPLPPVKPERPGEPIKRPSVNPDPLAKKKASEDDVVDRLLKILSDEGDSIENYI
jgi:hypothetical protein